MSTTLKKHNKKHSKDLTTSHSEQSLLHAAASSPKTKQPAPDPLQSRGGYQCNLVRQLSKPLLIHCTVCTAILRDPCQVTCCGQAFCSMCLTHIVRESKSCPNCRAGSFDGFLNESLQKELGKIEVHCSNQKEGCTWTGKLKRLDKHLNLDGEIDPTSYSICQYAHTTCPACLKRVQRSQLAHHVTESCIKRPYNCQFCGEYKSTFEDVMTNHRPTCKYSPTPCPNNCGENIMYVDLDSHMQNDCLMKVLECEFKAFGCTAEQTRKAMPAHLQEKSNTHMSMLAKTLSASVKRIEVFQSEMRKEIKKLRDENRMLQQRVDTLTPGDAKITSKTPIVILANRGPDDEREVLTSRDKNTSSSVELLTTAEFTMSEYAKHKRENKAWFSPPFYTYQKGYRMCLEVLANGEGKNKGQCVAVYAYFMRGEFDSTLEWPFYGEIMIELVNQEKGHSHAKTIRYTSTTPKKYAECAVTTERSAYGKGIPDFIHLSELPNKFLKNDSLVFRVLRHKSSPQK